MRLLDSLRFRIASLLRRSQMNAEMEEELRSHIQHRADDLEWSGLPRPEAERRARIEFGGYQKFKEECRETVAMYLFETLLQDLRLALHRLGKSPGFTVVAVGTLALAIGANAVVFGVLNALILRPLSAPHAETLYLIERTSDKFGPQSYPDYVDLRDRNRSFEGLAVSTAAQAGLDTGENPSRVWAAEVSGNFFDVLGVPPYLGRFFRASDEHGANSAPYIVLTHAYWQTHFQGDRGVVGRTVWLNKHPFAIAGVAPPELDGTFFFPDIYVPIVDEEQVQGAIVTGTESLNARGNHLLMTAIGRLKPGVTPQQAVADLDSIGSWLERTYPKVDGQMSFVLAHPGPLPDAAGPVVRPFLTGLVLLAGLILLAACANLGSLFAARTAERSREVALRLALGSSRKRILRQLFTEALLISLIGGAFGLLASVDLLGGLSAWRPFSRFPIRVPVNPDAHVYAIALVLAMVSGILFGIVPVRQVLRVDPYPVVKSGSAGPIGRPGRRITVRDLLLGVQIAICAVLITSSIVAVRGLARSLHSDFGFVPENVMLVDTDLSMAGYSGGQAPAMQKRMIHAMEMILGVTSVGLIDRPPLDGTWKGANVFADETGDLRPSNAAAEPGWYSISPGYFHAADTALLSGRAFTWHDDKNAPRVAVINKEFARKLFGSVTNAIGRHYKIADGMRVQVVGVVEDGKYETLTEDPQPAMFFPIQQSPSSTTSLVVRSKRDPQQLTQDMRSALRKLDAQLPSYMETWNKALDISLFGARMATLSLGVLGVIGALLSVTGIFGVAAYSVSKRKKELGIRIALGAQRKEVLEAALGRAFRLLAFGSAAGLLFGILASRVLALVVYQATPRDPLVLAGAVLAMLLLGLLATWIPAQRALSIDPVMLLREE
jgi:predicted permease